MQIIIIKVALCKATYSSLIIDWMFMSDSIKLTGCVIAMDKYRMYVLEAEKWTEIDQNYMWRLIF
jgi:hypothetical protein